MTALPGNRREHREAYWEVYLPTHPLSRRDGWVFEHRVVLFDQTNAGSHPCQWCRFILSWEEIVVDHLDGDRKNNEVHNLVHSCWWCNRFRWIEEEIGLGDSWRALLKAIGDTPPDERPSDPGLVKQMVVEAGLR